MDRKNRLSAVGVLIAAFAALPVLAQPADPASGKPKPPEKAELKSAKADAKEAKADAKEAKADAKEAKADAKDAKADAKDAKAAAKDAKAEEKADKKGEPGSGPGHVPGTDPQPGHGKDRHYARGYRGLGVDFMEGKVTKAELKERIAAMQASKAERKKEHREGLKKRWGATLAHPACREELRHHGRREAFLSRALFLAQTESPTKDRTKLVERIQKLIEKEEDRHTRMMERLKSTPPGASTAPAAPAPSAAPALAPSAKAGDK